MDRDMQRKDEEKWMSALVSTHQHEKISPCLV
jgi:hypothetical protein